MSCEEVRSYFDELDRGLRELPAEAMRHVSNCAPCRDFANTRKDVLANLRLLRESAPRVTDSLDSAVLARYRERMAAPGVSIRSHWANLPIDWRFAALATAALVIFAGVMLERKTSNPAQLPVQSPRAPEIAKNSVPDAHNLSKSQDDAVRRKASARRSSIAIPTHHVAVAPPARQEDPQEFRSLMYCDELSCDGGMDVVRVELPSLPSGFLPASNTPTRRVSAEVLVGADGFARGIRIVH